MILISMYIGLKFLVAWISEHSRDSEKNFSALSVVSRDGGNTYMFLHAKPYLCKQVSEKFDWNRSSG